MDEPAVAASVMGARPWRRLWRQLLRLVPTLVIVAGALGAYHVWARPAASPLALVSTRQIPYQGRLARASGAVVNGPHAMIFNLYNASDGDMSLWSESWTADNAVQVTGGLFNVMLGSISPIPTSLFDNSALWLGIRVNGDAEMVPRVPLGSAPFAMRAQTVPDGSIGARQLAEPPLVLLGHDSCYVCNPSSITQTNSSGWMDVKGASLNDTVEVTAETQGRMLQVQITAGMQLNPASAYYCAIAVYDESLALRRVTIQDGYSHPTDAHCSGSWLFHDLPAGTYRFVPQLRLLNAATQVTWAQARQIAVYELLQP